MPEPRAVGGQEPKALGGQEPEAAGGQGPKAVRTPGPPQKSRAARISKAVWRLLREAATGWLEHRAASTGAALAFYTVFSLAPVLTLSIAIAGFFFGKAAARGEIVEQIGDLVGPQGAELVQLVLRNASQPGDGTLTTVISVVTLILGANTALAELKLGLDRAWNVPPHRQAGFWYSIRTRLLSVGMILSLGFLLLVSLVFGAALAALERLSHGEMLVNTVLSWINALFAFVLTAALFATIYKMLPSVRVAWWDVTIGSLVTAVLLTAGKFAIGAYIGNSGLASTYGAAGSVVLLLVWVYYSAQILLYGAEFTRAFAYRYGSCAKGYRR
jgi:membrane protein